MQLPELKMDGRSGCELVVERLNDKTQIRKFSSSVVYNNRLIKQAEKQKSFFHNSTLNIFTTAEVYAIDYSDTELAWFTMPYLFAEKYSNYLDRIPLDELKFIVKNIINYFETNFKKAQVELVEENLFLEKLSDVEFNVNKNSIIEDGLFDNVFTYLRNNIPQEKLPLGPCHGDFTFSNILFGDDEIYLLDFLDSFIESPLIDVVKLRQDTCYKWSIMLESSMPTYKSNKLIQVFNYIDKHIAQYCDDVLNLGTWYIYLQAFNLIRIAPYLTKIDEVYFIKTALKKLLQ